MPSCAFRSLAAQVLGKRALKFDQKSIKQMIKQKLNELLIVVGSFWEPFGGHFGSQVGPKSALDRSKTALEVIFLENR